MTDGKEREGAEGVAAWWARGHARAAAARATRRRCTWGMGGPGAPPHAPRSAPLPPPGAACSAADRTPHRRPHPGAVRGAPRGCPPRGRCSARCLAPGGLGPALPLAPNLLRHALGAPNGAPPAGELREVCCDAPRRVGGRSRPSRRAASRGPHRGRPLAPRGAPRARLVPMRAASRAGPRGHPSVPPAPSCCHHNLGGVSSSKPPRAAKPWAWVTTPERPSRR
jgi:hypothetical protein